MRNLNKNELSDYNNSIDRLFNSVYVVVFYNSTAQQTQAVQIEAKNEFRAGRAFYRKYKGKYRIELIHKVIMSSEETR